ncbi:urea ABC transporter ATP-binding subunit UrtE [Desulfogranum japonicum]|uniref:urea ABC transporter ATP-binding subunit UrtE n=1 Tax=Desulfogranum japonicum TaxID=231447 RepID=UPI0004281186|nr:urea ABC transporter ATP-binding subunit UrtE [Desulfogranum japonicum]
MLQIEQLNQYYGESHTLWDIELQVPAGQCTALMGRNGVGKTTLLSCIMGHQAIASGSILLQDQPLHKLAVEKRAALGVGYVPQGRQIFPLLTVRENLEIGLKSGRKKQQAIPELIFELFPVLHEMLNRRGGDLSGGQQQQLAIGRALVLDPQLLILDEPTEGIQPNIVQEIGDIIQRLKSELGMTILLVEQKLKFVRAIADRFAILDRGRAMASGDIDTLNENLIREYLTV